AAPEKAILDAVGRKGNEYIMVINQCDQHEDELAKREEDIRQNYARTLNVNQELIIFTSSKNPERVNYVRRLLFSMLSIFVDKNVGKLAAILLHEKDKQVLAREVDLMNKVSDTENAIARFLRDNIPSPITPTLIRERIFPS